MAAAAAVATVAAVATAAPAPGGAVGLASTTRGAAGSKPHLFVMLLDDLGYYDAGYTGNWANLNVTSAISTMAHNGITLRAHYAHYWCSPTRRSFLSGRLPIHAGGEMLSAPHADHIDLRWSIISQKLAPAGYANYWFGKGHTGFKSMAHLPTSRGFANYTGFLGGSQSYRSSKRWEADGPLNCSEYSTELFGDRAITTLRQHDPLVPIFMYLPFQAVHAPYDQVPGWVVGPGRSMYQGMLWSADKYVAAIRELLEIKQMWDDSLVVFSSDNGGRGGGNNYPLRGEKATNYEGGMRVSSFVSGGLIPTRLRGTASSIRFHIVDWYPTFCYLAGVPASDPSPVPPAPVDPANPGADVYGNQSWPDIDGVMIWDHLMNPEKYSPYSAHQTLVLSGEVILQGQFKLMTAERGDTKEGFNPYINKWTRANGTRWAPPDWRQTCGQVADPWGSKPFKPCLFDLEADLNETTDLSPQKPGLARFMWQELNRSLLRGYTARSPPKLLGPCDQACATIRWKTIGGLNASKGPICGVPGCPRHQPRPSPPALSHR